MIEWVFFDVGNVLFDDSSQNFEAYRHYFLALRAVRPDYTFEEMLLEREELARRGETWLLHKIARRSFPDSRVDELYEEFRSQYLPRYDEVHFLHKGLWETLGLLKKRYRLGIIANQPPECRQSLARRGLLDLFGVVAISEELDLHKPDPELFRWALDQSGCEPKRAAMVGDRRDNDIAPAKSLGMRTILLQWHSAAGKSWCPQDPMARAFLESIERVSVFHSIEDPSNEPDRTAHSLWEVAAAVGSLDGSIS